MTISKKLFLIATLGLNCTPFASAYDVVGLKDEVQLISKFANQYDAIEYNDQTIYLGYWLNEKIKSTGRTSDYHIIEIANIIKQDNAVENLLIMKKREEKARDILIEVIIMTTVITGAMFGLLSLMNKSHKHESDHWGLNYSIKHLTRVIDEQQRQINELTQKVNKTWFQKLFATA